MMVPVLRSCLAFKYGAMLRLRNVTIALIFASMPAAAEPLTLVALGDSLTQGYGLPPDQGFVPQLQDWLTAQGREVVVVNAGVSGDTTAGGRARLDWTLTAEVDAMIVNLGGNDMLRGIDPGEVRANLEAILSAATARGLPVLLVGLEAPGNYGPDYKATFDAVYPDLAAQYGAILEDSYFRALVGAAGDMPAREVMQPDGIHPNAKGVALTVAALGPKVLDLLDRAKPD